MSIKRIMKSVTKKPVIWLNKVILTQYLRREKKHVNIEELHIEKSRVLILSPHQDDETLGCGCLILSLVENKCKVKTVFLTDGRNSESYEYDAITLAKVREEEANKVSTILNMLMPDFIRCPDGELCSLDAGYGKRLFDIINDFQPDTIFMPYFLDGLKDHSATSGLLLSVINKIDRAKDITYFAYEINSPISIYGITHYIDGTSYIEKKEETLRNYKSQIMSFDSIILMNKINKILVDKKCTAIELYQKLEIEKYSEAYWHYNKNNEISNSFRTMYSIYFMIAAYFKGMSIKKEIAEFLRK